MRMNVPDLELIHSWLLDGLDKDELAFARQRGLDLRGMIRARIESFATRFKRIGYVVLVSAAIAIYVFGGAFMRSRGIITDWIGEVSLVGAVLFATAIGFSAIRFQASYTFNNIERRVKAKNDLTLQYVRDFVTHDIRRLRLAKKGK